MLFGVAMAVGGLFAWNAVQIGFFNTWIMFFHVLLAVYLAIFLAPVMASDTTAVVTTSWGFALTMICIVIATLSIGYGICFLCLSGRFHVAFPKTFDTLVAGFVGFLTGFLVLSFITLTMSLSPLSQFGFCKAMDLEMTQQSTNTAYVYWWCDWMHMLIGSGVPRSSDEAVSILMTRTTKPLTQVAKAKPPTPLRRPARAARPMPQPVAAAPKPAANAAEPKPPVPPAKAAPAVDPHRRPGESWEEELARRRILVTSPEDVLAAIANSQVRIIEVADVCTADKFDSKQTGLFQRWASDGGVVWATNDVLVLFGISHTRLVWWGGGLECTAATGKTPVLVACQKVVLKNAGGKAHSLTGKGAMPLLVLEKDIPFEDKAGTACWSLVAYGNGWISDPKAVDTTQYDGGQFWSNFCQFCLGRELAVPTAAKTSVVAVEKPAPPSTPRGPLSGTWQASTGAKVCIEDDGQTVTITGIADNLLRSFTGTLVRRDDDPATISLAGRVDAVFAVDAHKKYAVDFTATADGSDSIRVRCADWPVWNNKGRYLGTRPATDVWTRSEGPHK